MLENDDRLFDIADMLETVSEAGMPAVYDNLHNAVNPADTSRRDVEWIEMCRETWTNEDGPQKVHYSQQNQGKKPGAHSESIRIDEFLDYHREVSRTGTDIMLEVKDKNLSALKCMNCVSDRGIGALESDWTRYKYSVLERSQEGYDRIRALLRDKSAYPAQEMYRTIEESLGRPATAGNADNAAQHVWGHVNGTATEAERKRFRNALQDFASGRTDIWPVKNILLKLAQKYWEEYLLNAYYLCL